MERAARERVLAVYLVTGKLGSGKTLVTVGKIRDAIKEGRRIATNLDLNLDALVGPQLAAKARVVRLPDKPDARSLELIGVGNESLDEGKNALLVLDELASFLNARSWNDPSRKGILEFLIHSRKLGWDCFLIAQHIDQIDSQIRTSLVEFLVVCRRLDRMSIPFIGRFLRWWTAGLVKARLPRLHIAVVRYGQEKDSPVTDSWKYRGRDLFDAYDTRQIFVNDPTQAPYSLWRPNPAHDYLKPKRRWVQRLLILPPDERVSAVRRLWGLDPPPWGGAPHAVRRTSP